MNPKTVRRYAMRHERMPDSFEVAKTFCKAFVVLLVLIPVGITLAAIVVWLQ